MTVTVNRFKKTIIILCFYLLHSNSYSFEYNKTNGNCSPIITGDINGDVTLKCRNRKGDVRYSITMDNKKDENNVKLKYKKTVVNSEIHIVPNITINTSLYDIVEIVKKDYTDYQREFNYPTFDFKISNNTDETIVIDHVQINVKESKLFKSPYIRYGEYQVETYCSDSGLTFSNIGNLPAKEVTITFNIASIPQDIFNNKEIPLEFDRLKYKREFSIGKMSIKRINIDEEIKAEGVDFKNITLKNREDYGAYLTLCREDDSIDYMGFNCLDAKKNYKEIINKVNLGKFGNIEDLKDGSYEEPFIYGYIEYEYYNPFSKKFTKIKNKFRAKVNLFPFSECGGGLYVSEKYNYKLKTEGVNYTIDANNISHVIKSEEADRFTLTLGVDKASFHILEVKIHTIEQGYLPTKNIKLFIPKY